MATQKSFSINEAISYGWKKATSKLSFFFVILLIVIAATAIPSMLAAVLSEGRPTLITFALRLLSWALQLVVSLGLINVSLRIFDNKKTKYANLFDKSNLILPYFLASVIYTLIVIAGFILLIVPGIIWAIQFRFFTYFMVDRGMGPIDALKESSKITRGVKWQLFLLSIVLLLINLLGAIILLVGLFVTIPMTIMIETYVYRKLAGK